MDKTGELISKLTAKDLRFKGIHFSKNFGHQLAITAGYDFAQGDYVLVLDGDLQDPPELVHEMLQECQHNGFDIVLARRKQRQGETIFKKLTASLFYWLMRRAIDPNLPGNIGDFRMMNRKAVNALNRMREKHRFIRGMVAWVGFNQKIIEFERPPRAAGETKYPLKKMVRFAWTAITSFSAVPLYVVLGVGMIVFGFGLCYSIFALYMKLFTDKVQPGWTALIIFQFIFSGFTMIALGVLGSYVGKIFEEIKDRPLYIVDRVDGLKSLIEPQE